MNQVSLGLAVVCSVGMNYHIGTIEVRIVPYIFWGEGTL